VVTDVTRPGTSAAIAPLVGRRHGAAFPHIVIHWRTPATYAARGEPIQLHRAALGVVAQRQRMKWKHQPGTQSRRALVARQVFHVVRYRVLAQAVARAAIEAALL
jgi:hypothetical protein